MKKLLALLLTMSMVLSLAACGSQQEGSTAPAGSTNAVEKETTAGGYRKLAKDEYLSLITGSSGGG